MDRQNSMDPWNRSSSARSIARVPRSDLTDHNRSQSTPSHPADDARGSDAAGNRRAIRKGQAAARARFARTGNLNAAMNDAIFFPPKLQVELSYDTLDLDARTASCSSRCRCPVSASSISKVKNQSLSCDPRERSRIELRSPSEPCCRSASRCLSKEEEGRGLYKYPVNFGVDIQLLSRPSKTHRERCQRRGLHIHDGKIDADESPPTCSGSAAEHVHAAVLAEHALRNLRAPLVTSHRLPPRVVAQRLRLGDDCPRSQLAADRAIPVIGPGGETEVRFDSHFAAVTGAGKCFAAITGFPSVIGSRTSCPQPD